MTAIASVRAMITVSGFARAASAARTFRTISSRGMTLLALHVTAALREGLILDLHGRGARALVLPHGAGDVRELAEAGVGVGDHRERDRAA